MKGLSFSLKRAVGISGLKAKNGNKDQQKDTL